MNIANIFLKKDFGDKILLRSFWTGKTTLAAKVASNCLKFNYEKSIQNNLFGYLCAFVFA